MTQFWRGILLAGACMVAGVRSFGQQSASMQSDPARDAAAPAAMVDIGVPSHGSLLMGVFYTAAGAGLHPTVVLMHGFPGYEQNLDLAQAIRRAGWNVLAVHYRGSWGVKGDFSFSHAMEDADAMVAFVEDPAVAAKYRVDRKKVVVVGHSMGGYMVASAAAHNPAVAGMVMISGWNIAAQIQRIPDVAEAQVVAGFAKSRTEEDLRPLAGCTAETLGRDMFEHRAGWTFDKLSSAIAPRPALIVTSDDGMAAGGDAMAGALKKGGDSRVETAHLATDHSYSDKRVALMDLVVRWLGTV